MTTSYGLFLSFLILKSLSTACSHDFTHITFLSYTIYNITATFAYLELVKTSQGLLERHVYYTDKNVIQKNKIS